MESTYPEKAVINNIFGCSFIKDFHLHLPSYIPSLIFCLYFLGLTLTGTIVGKYVEFEIFHRMGGNVSHKGKSFFTEFTTL